MRFAPVSFAALCAMVSALACSSPDAESGDQCGPNGECPPGYTCDPTTNRCVRSGGTVTPDAATAPPDVAPPPPDAPPPMTVAPETLITGMPAARTREQGATFTFTGTPEGVTFECRIDELPFAPCTSPKSYTGLAAETHRFEVRARAGASVDDTPATFTWLIDRGAPIAVIVGGPAAGGASGASGTFTYATATPEPGATFECALDDAPFAPCPASGFAFSGLAHGSRHTFRVVAIDALGNRGPEASRPFIVDIEGPAAAITNPPDGGTTGLSFALVFTFTAEPGASFSCRLDGGEARAGCLPGALFTTSPGRHTVTVQGTDARGNQGPLASSTFTAVPSSTVEILFPLEGGTTGPSGMILYATGDAARLRCALDNRDVACELTGLPFTGLSGGRHTFTVRGLNAAGEEGPPDRVTWNVDASGPTVTIVPPGDVRSDADSCADGAIALSCATGCPAGAFTCKLDGEAVDCAAGMVAFSGLRNGSHTLEAQAVDEHGNLGAVSVLTWRVDARAPDVTIDAPAAAAGPTSGPAGEISLAPMGDRAAVTGCVVDGKTSCCLTSPCDAGALAFSDLGDAANPHEVTVTVADRCGNEGSAQRSWNVDSTPPVAIITSGPAAGAPAPRSGSFTFTTEKPEEGASFRCSLDDAMLAACPPDRSFAFADLEPGSAHTFRVLAIDRFDNRGPAATRTFTVAPRATVEIVTPREGAVTGRSGMVTYTTANATGARCALDGKTVACGLASYAFSDLAGGAHGFTVRGVNVLGEAGPADSLAWTVDATPPVAVITGGPAAGGVSGASGTFTYSTSPLDATASFQCALDSLDLAPCAASGFPFSGLAHGSKHTFRVLAVDAAGNRGPTASRTFTVDIEGPVVTITSPPDGGTVAATFDLAFTFPPDPGATFVCVLDGKTTRDPCPSPQTFTAASGSHTLTVRGTDARGNQGPVASTTFTVAPAATVTITSPDDGATTGPSGTIAYTTANASSVTCKLDGATVTCGPASYAYGGLSGGSHTFTVRAVNSVGVAGGSDSVTFTVDATGPTLVIDPPPGDTCASGRIAFHCQSDCPASRTDCKIDGKTVACGDGAVSFSGLAGGAHQLQVQGFDALGNAGPVASLTWSVDGTGTSFTIASPEDTRPAPSSGPSGEIVLSSGSELDVASCVVDDVTCCTTSPCDAGALAFSGLSEGGNPHTVTVTATDACGNRTVRSVSWNVDATPPSISALTVTDAAAGDGKLTFKASISDASAVAHAFTRLDGGAFRDRGAVTSVTTTPTALSAGEHLLDVYAVDEWGNSGLVAQPDPTAAPSPHAVVRGTESYPPNMGRLVVLGHDAAETSADLQRLLQNAVGLVPFQQIPLAFDRPIRVLGVDTGGVTDGERKHVLDAIGTLIDYDELDGSSEAALRDGLVGHDLLLVFDQNASASAMGALGAAWHDRLLAFLEAGGVVLLLDGRTAAGEPSQTVALAAAGKLPLLDAIASPYAATSPALDPDLADHPLRAGVPEEYVPPANTVGIETDGDRGQPLDLYTSFLSCPGECFELGATVIDKIFPVYVLGADVERSPSGASICPAGTIDLSITPASGPGYPTGAKTTCELDGQAVACAPGDALPYRTTDEGSFPQHQLVFRLEDVHGNPGRLVRTEFFVDRDPPTVVTDFKSVCLEPDLVCPTGFTCNRLDHICYQNTSKNISDTIYFWTSQFEAPGATFSCKIDPGGTFVSCPCAAPYQDCGFSYSDQSCGSHTFTIQAQDECGPSGGATSTRTFAFDIFCGPF